VKEFSLLFPDLVLETASNMRMGASIAPSGTNLQRQIALLRRGIVFPLPAAAKPSG